MKKIIRYHFISLLSACSIFVCIFYLFACSGGREQQYLSFCENNKNVHFSIDDTIEIFRDLTENQEEYESIFQNETLQFLKNCNDKYGIKVSFYCFGEYNGFTLVEATDKYKEEFEKNSHWMKFGFHALNANSNYDNSIYEDALKDYEIVINQLKRVVGDAAITTTIRMEKFLGNLETLKAISQNSDKKINILGADNKERINYYLGENEKKYLFENDYYFDKLNEIMFFKTDFRIENLENLDEVEEYFLKNTVGKSMIFFTHENLLTSENKDKIEMFFDYLVGYDYVFTFLEF